MPPLTLSFRNIRSYNRWPAVTACLFLLLMPRYADAAPGDTFNATVGTAFTYDSNVFRLSPVINPVAVTGMPTRSDQIIISTFSLNLNKVYSMQRFDVTGSLIDNRYNNFDFLNFLGKNYTAAWHWYVTPYLHGRLTSSHSEVLNNFANLTGFANSTTQNLRTNDNYHFEGIFEIDRAWHIVGGLDHNVSKNSKLTIQDFSNRVSSVEGGIRYTRPSGASLTYKVRSGTGEFINRPKPIVESLFDTRFNEIEHEVRLLWPVTGKAFIDARGGYLSREHAHFPQRDYAGIVGNVNLTWAATGKLRVNANWTRQLSNYQTAPSAFLNSAFQRFSSSSVTTNRFTVSPVWQITEKTALRLRYDYVLSDFEGAVISLPTESRSDSMHSGLVALDWQPLKVVFLSAAFHRDRRTSNLRGFDFDSTAGSISAKLNF
ncbi:XrtB/PEP-CTERM-associated polysaccharide biosynthesis outer membrane protein EpsL [Nitrosospira briensis]|uniref:XrtB/PEP-CTERM-associated polysaccharide biosynthesis outer membrane protein EpsL n=1 Tax=Nitrosospira briensis TaxID=35799 RepID=UPI00046A8DE3|nr:XrtB/PEP-CTERM-associated polysaccharide biosynthesis outer membrane protein EpsL [Nitrosospira briensis]